MKINPVNLGTYQKIDLSVPRDRKVTSAEPGETASEVSSSFKGALADIKPCSDLKELLSQEEKEMLKELFGFPDGGKPAASYNSQGTAIMDEGRVGMGIDTRA